MKKFKLTVLLTDVWRKYKKVRNDSKINQMI